MELVVMGFEPGGQAASGSWEEIDVNKSVINYIQQNGYGGVMFQAINQLASPPSTEITGKNSQVLAEYAKTQFTNANAVKL